LNHQESSRQVTMRATPRRHFQWLGSLLSTLFVLLLLAGLGTYLYVRHQLTPVTRHAPVREFEVLPGWGATRVSDALASQGFIRNADVFSYYLRTQNLDRTIGEGLYELSPSLSSQEIARRLSTGGRPRTVRIVIPEGFRAGDIVSRFATNGFDDAIYRELINNPEDLRPSFIPADKPLEGFLFPASYDAPVRAEPRDHIRMMLRRFEQELTPEVQEQLETLELTVYEWVTLASMIQAEAANSGEMPIIAGVFLNRMDRDMLFQSDPTAAYGLGIALPELVAADLRVDHAWNTYTRPGLPTTPINNPGRDALLSIFNPVRLTEDGDPYLYFLHGTDNGVPVFRPNISLADHERDIDLYLR
jgi:UPF0755 protein